MQYNKNSRVNFKTVSCKRLFYDMEFHYFVEGGLQNYGLIKVYAS